MTIAFSIAAAVLAAGYLWIGVRMWRAMMGAHRVLTISDDPTEPEALFHAAWVRRDPRIRFFHITFVSLWPACLVIGAVNAAIASRRMA